MRKIINLVIIALFLSILAVTGLQAQGTFTAASCGLTDVNDCINGSGANTCKAQGASAGATHTAVDGDTINIPAGSCTWTSGITISGVALQIMGSGTPNTTPSATGAGSSNTVIVDGLNDGKTPLLNFANVPVTSHVTRVSLLTIQPGPSVTNGYSPIAISGVCSSSTCPSLRIDNLNFTGWTEAGNGDQSSWMIRTDNLFGVVDHSTVTGPPVFANINHSAYLGVGGYGDNSWAQPDAFGTGNAMYFENNSLGSGVALNDCDAAPPNGGTGGCRVVARFNTSANIVNYLAYDHGTETGQRMRGGRSFEIYGNTANCTGSCPAGSQLRSGVAMNWGNTYAMAAGAGINNFLSLYIDRTFAGFPPWGYCAGQGGYDNNDGKVYASGTLTSSSKSGGTLTVGDSAKSWTSNQWSTNGDPYSFVDLSVTTSEGVHPGYEISSNTSNTLVMDNYGNDYWDGPPTISVGDSYEILHSGQCIDQPSRSGGTYLSGGTPSPTGWSGQSLDPTYEWMDTETGGSPWQGVVVPATLKLINNRDFYQWCNASAQTGCTSFDGTQGVGSGTLANRPSTCTAGVGYFATNQGSWNGSGNGFGQGELFICGSSGWPSTASYTPYTYPHPLTQSAGPLLPPTGVQAVAH